MPLKIKTLPSRLPRTFPDAVSTISCPLAPTVAAKEPELPINGSIAVAPMPPRIARRCAFTCILFSLLLSPGACLLLPRHLVDFAALDFGREIIAKLGRASGRERGCPYV